MRMQYMGLVVLAFQQKPEGSKFIFGVALATLIKAHSFTQIARPM